MPATRSLDGVDLPAPGVWEIDPGHAEVAFIGRHFMLTKVRGRFTGVSGAIVLAVAWLAVAVAIHALHVVPATPATAPARA